ncbi:hypothetical protein EVAR_18300_1 [Eumeta japonica]|uniref:Uncharacterized protein n=1 Tax=Eumeta variegata TaxID=151549 RepID=A0A4C1VC38_EUMVA|nr:hypothetical protein EVAR_18300_1 [Eumeta japonica]
MRSLCFGEHIDTFVSGFVVASLTSVVGDPRPVSRSSSIRSEKIVGRATRAHRTGQSLRRSGGFSRDNDQISFLLLSWAVMSGLIYAS